jgi:hypothetical protein
VLPAATSVRAEPPQGLALNFNVCNIHDVCKTNVCNIDNIHNIDVHHVDDMHTILLMSDISY